MKKVIASALFIAALTGTAFAQTSGDLILGFRASGGTGSTSNLEVDLGSISNFANFTGGTEVVTNLLNSLPAGDSIDSVYGSSWNTRSDVNWGIAGAILAGQTGPDGEPQTTLFGTVVAPASVLDGSSSTTPYNNGTTQSTPRNKLAAVYGNMTGPVSVVDATTPTSWTGEVGTTPAAFSYFSKTLFDNTLALGGTYDAGDLYKLTPAANVQSIAPGTFEGTFAIHSNGDVTFSAVPEPSTYAAILGALVLGVVLIRRRQQIAA